MKQDSLRLENIAPLAAGQTCALPFPETLVAAGFPSAIENFSENSLDLNDLLIKNSAATFYVRVVGDSMINAGIQSGDILIVDRSLPLAHNKIAVVRLDDEFTVKRIVIDGTTVTLMPENEQYKPIPVTDDIDFELWGIVTFVIHTVA